MTLASDVYLSMPIVWLPVGGTIIRIACGSTIRRIVCSGVKPERLGGLGLPVVDGEDAAADDLGHVRALVEAEAEQRREERRDQRVRVATAPTPGRRTGCRA